MSSGMLAATREVDERKALGFVPIGIRDGFVAVSRELDQCFVERISQITLSTKVPDGLAHVCSHTRATSRDTGLAIGEPTHLFTGLHRGRR
jgi:hypothetical protein